MKIGLAGVTVAVGTLFLVIAVVVGVRRDQGQGALVIYTSVDQQYSEPVFRVFEAETGIAVRAVYDVEAAKTTGLVNRLVAESSNPQAAVFWNGEVSQMQRLVKAGVLAPYRPQALPDGAVVAGSGLWIEFGGRARVLIANTERLGTRSAPGSIRDLESDAWEGPDIAVAYPLFGTTATHALALAQIWGEDETIEFFKALDRKGVRFVAGNSVVRDLVASGQAVFGLTDTDDACSAAQRGAPVTVILPDQAEDASGTLVIPNSVALISSPKPDPNAAKFIDFLISDSTQTMLAQAGWTQVHGSRVMTDPACGLPETLKRLPLRLPEDPTVASRLFRNLKQALVR
ncbi:extracellular solute-binding protein [Marimonas arenosa]|uniref:Extracellular solute-binding protein n=1 Tax=Marimonas arenosa TaxID=1795305 RepID=A0AAE3WCS7_9RHOB|nr:extracellular solute-binding protein [Marimonas arenosa]MDQ2090075.1 extracellular solute-binding protein [Marimonas arenosa]